MVFVIIVFDVVVVVVVVVNVNVPIEAYTTYVKGRALAIFCKINHANKAFIQSFIQWSYIDKEVLSGSEAGGRNKNWSVVYARHTAYSRKFTTLAL